MSEHETPDDIHLFPSPPVDPRIVGNRLRHARRFAGYENAETFAALLREKMGVTIGGNPVTAPTLRRIERGDQDATLALVVATVALTGISFDWYLAAVRPDVAPAFSEAKNL